MALNIMKSAGMPSYQVVWSLALIAVAWGPHLSQTRMTNVLLEATVLLAR